MAEVIVWEGFQADCHVKNFYDKAREELVHRHTHVADTSNKEQLRLLPTQSVTALMHHLITIYLLLKILYILCILISGTIITTLLHRYNIVFSQLS